MPLQLEDLAALDAPAAESSGRPMMLAIDAIDEDAGQPRRVAQPLGLARWDRADRRLPQRRVAEPGRLEVVPVVGEQRHCPPPGRITSQSASSGRSLR